MQSADSPSSGVVELREDIPLKAGAGGAGASAGCGGPRLIASCFAAFSLAVAIALLTQIYYGDYQVVPHGSVSAGAEACSSAGTDALKAGGGAMDAAVAAALCLALLAPHRTSLDASGSMIFWEYRAARAQGPELVEWGGPGDKRNTSDTPRLLAALAELHADRGILPWSNVLQPAIDLAKNGFVVSKALGLAAAGAEVLWLAGTMRKDLKYAEYLEALQRNSSKELSASWSKGGSAVVRQSVQAASVGRWTLYAGGAGAAVAARALHAALSPVPDDADDAERRVVAALLEEAHVEGWPPSGVATGMAIVDPTDTYLALVTGLSMPFGSMPPWGMKSVEFAAEYAGNVAVPPSKASAVDARDQPGAPLDMSPAILLDGEVCGTRYVLGAESSGALAQSAAAFAAGAELVANDAELSDNGVERARVGVLAGGALVLEGELPPALASFAAAAKLNATPPFPAVNVVQQKGDGLVSHADSRGGGVSSRF